LGAAGLTSAAAEMASKGGVGVEIDVDRVPLREPGMEPFEVMVSESQERMLCVVEPSTVPAVLAACERWEIGGAAIGTVTDTGRVRVLDAGRTVGDMPVAALVDECPLYDIAPSKPPHPPYEPPPARLAADAPPREALLALLAPIVGGNVSLYNEGAAGPIYPTPVIGMVGRLPDAKRAGRLGFRCTGDRVALVGRFRPALGASELAKLRGEPLPDGLAPID